MTLSIRLYVTKLHTGQMLITREPTKGHDSRSVTWVYRGSEISTLRWLGGYLAALRDRQDLVTIDVAGLRFGGGFFCKTADFKRGLRAGKRFLNYLRHRNLQ